MKRALVFLGDCSPAFLAVLDVFSIKQDLELVFIETSVYKSKLPKGYVGRHILLKDFKSDLQSVMASIYHKYEHFFCLCVSYNNALKYWGVEDIEKRMTCMFATEKCIATLINKKLMSVAAEQANLPILTSSYLPGDDTGLLYPIAIRPVDEGKADFKAALISNKEELEPYLNNSVIAQPFIKGPNLVAHIVKSNENFEVEYFFVNHKFEGVTLSIERVSSKRWDCLNDNINIFLNQIDFNGVGHIEFIVDEKNIDQVYFLDFNGRLGGTTLKSYALGYNEIEKLLLIHGIKVKTPKNAKIAKKVTNPLSLVKYFIQTIRGKSDLLDYPQKNMATNIKEGGKLLLLARSELSFVSWRIRFHYIMNTIIEKFKGA